MDKRILSKVISGILATLSLTTSGVAGYKVLASRATTELSVPELASPTPTPSLDTENEESDDTVLLSTTNDTVPASTSPSPLPAVSPSVKPITTTPTFPIASPFPKASGSPMHDDDRFEDEDEDTIEIEDHEEDEHDNEDKKDTEESDE